MTVALTAGRTPGFEHLRWPVDGLARPSLRAEDFGIPDRAKRTRYPLRLLRYWFMQQLLRRERARAGRPLSICEIGVDSGQMRRFVTATADRGAEPASASWAEWSAVDRQMLAAPLLAAGYTRLVEADIEQAGFHLDAGSDVTILLHVLEHLFEPEAAFARIAESVPPGGLVIGGHPVVPQALVGVRERQLRRSARPFGHVSAFSPQRIRAMAAANGFEVELLSGAYLARLSGSWLENSVGWLRLNLLFGALFPGFPGELYWALRKRAPGQTGRLSAEASPA